MLPIEIKNEEALYRAIKPFPNWWKTDTNRPSSAAFKDSRGVSVDRDGGRLPSEIVRNFQNRFTIKAVVSILAGECRSFGTHPISAPEIPTNPEHAVIHCSPTEIELTSGQAKNLSKTAKIEYLNPLI